MNNPLYSIMIPTYNRADLVSKAIDSALAQDYSPIEIIVVDNCSSDDTWDVLQKYQIAHSNIRIYQNKNNVGPVLNWVACMEKAEGEYGKFLFSDDLLAPTFVSETMALFDEATAFVISDIRIFSTKFINKDHTYRFPEKLSTKVYIEDSLIYRSYGYPVSPQAASFRMKDLRQNLIIDVPNVDNLDFKKFGAGNDQLIFLLTAKNYQWVRCVPKALTLFREHPNSFSVSNDLRIYYALGRYYFVNIFYRKLFATWMLLDYKNRCIRKKNVGSRHPYNKLILCLGIVGLARNWIRGKTIKINRRSCRFT
tara:strand:+ start:4671 stop:5597 length:927 start_codon:yes stop_codon:yes gene_type:complete